MGGELMGLYQPKSNTTVPSRASFPPFKKLNLTFFLSSKEEERWEKLEFLQYSRVSSNFKESWEMIAFTSENGREDHFNKEADDFPIKKCSKPNFEPTPIYKSFPSIEEFISKQKWIVQRIRGSRLLAGGKILRHTDPANVTEGEPVWRLHCVIRTNIQCLMSAIDIRGNLYEQHMKKGEVWLIHNYLPHSVVNFGNNHRDHLIIDVLNKQL
jgi:hypothetical protein